MIHEILQGLLSQQPFQPFRVHIHDHHHYDVLNPELVLLGQKYLHIGIPEPNHPDPFYDYMETVALQTVRRVEPLNAPAATPSP